MNLTSVRKLLMLEYDCEFRAYRMRDTESMYSINGVCPKCGCGLQFFFNIITEMLYTCKNRCIDPLKLGLVPCGKCFYDKHDIYTCAWNIEDEEEFLAEEDEYE